MSSGKPVSEEVREALSMKENTARQVLMNENAEKIKAFTLRGFYLTTVNLSWNQAALRQRSYSR